MKLVWWMLGASVLSSYAMTALLGGQTELEVWLGMTGPLAAALVAWIAMERTYRRNPGGLTSLMIKAFAAKMVFFGAYIALALTVLLVRPVPFVVSFTGYFIALHIIEAIGLHRLRTAGSRASAIAHRA